MSFALATMPMHAPAVPILHTAVFLTRQGVEWECDTCNIARSAETHHLDISDVFDLTLAHDDAHHLALATWVPALGVWVLPAGAHEDGPEPSDTWPGLTFVPHP